MCSQRRWLVGIPDPEGHWSVRRWGCRDLLRSFEVFPSAQWLRRLLAGRGRILLDIPSSHADIARKLAAVLVTSVIRVQIILGKYRAGESGTCICFVNNIWLVPYAMEILILRLHFFSVDPKKAGGFRGKFAPRQSLGQDVRDVVSGGHLANLDESQRHLLPDEVNQHQEVF